MKQLEDAQTGNEEEMDSKRALEQQRVELEVLQRDQQQLHSERDAALSRAEHCHQEAEYLRLKVSQLEHAITKLNQDSSQQQKAYQSEKRVENQEGQVISLRYYIFNFVIQLCRHSFF